MRVIAGSARRISLISLKGMETRPTLDRYKETLFNTIQTEVPGSIFVDVFAGCGGIGIEALSRGAERCFFLEHNKKAAEVIRQNLEKTHLSERGEVMAMDALTGLQKLERSLQGPADILFLDPPYGKGLEQMAMGFLSRSGLMGEDTLLIVEASNDTDFSFAGELGFALTKTKDYRSNRHLFFVKKSGAGSD
ncbi:MAG: 16S rRNA (guanine(966)-N(2))-methyltransferase RsmD [Lachnospiraceae bacterium]|nr:16S rRNA (guanine(966)-N(2))-methyltransferase RsmD [Lachnospiraceae bacterium]